MSPLQVEKKLQMFQKEKYIVLKEQQQTKLQEKQKSGKVELTVTALREMVILPCPERNVLPYLDGMQKGVTACADIFIYCWNRDSRSWDLHIIEFKKTINTDSIGKSKWQFTMGIYNGRAVAAFLGIELYKIYLYSGYRKDELLSMGGKSLIALHASNNKKALQMINQWKQGICRLEIDEEWICFPHQKIQLDQEGQGQISF